MTKKLTHLLYAGALCFPLPATAEASGKVIDGNRQYQIKEAACFVYPKRGDVEILLFDRLLNADEQAELLAWTGDSTMDFPSVGSIRVSFGARGLPKVLSLDDPNVSFINLGNHMMFSKEVRGSFKEWSITPKGCSAELQFKGKDNQVPFEYSVSIKAPVIPPQPAQAASADLVKAAQAFEAAEERAKSPEELAPFYTSTYLETLSHRKPRSAKEAELGMAFEKFRETMKAQSKNGKKVYTIIPRPSSVVLVTTTNLGGGASTTSKRVYVQENGQWKIFLDR